MSGSLGVQLGRACRRLAVAATCLVSSIVTTGCSFRSAQDGIPGDQLYAACAPCHGKTGAGNATLGAPRIAGMPKWYVADQLRRFQAGLRGKHPDDNEGLRMRAMSRQMLSGAEIEAVAGHVATLAPITNAAQLHGADQATGAPIYARCVPCHGARGEGNEQVKAPPLAGQDDWYIGLQLRKYRAGVRGRAAGDTVGPIMQAMASSVEPAAINHVAAYVHALPR